MSRQQSSLLNAANVGVLLSPLATSVTVGGITWTSSRKTAREGNVKVRTQIAELEPCALRLVVNLLSPAEPKLQYLISEGSTRFSARRLCVNTPHKPIGGTHKHRAEPSTYDESAYEPTDIPTVPLQPRVAPGTYRAILEAFAQECFIEIGSDFTWIDP